MNRTVKLLGKHIKPAIGIIGLVAVIIWSGGFLVDKINPDIIEYRSGFPVPADATVIEIKTESAPTRIDIVGTAASEKKINLRARIPAYINEIFASAGDRVAKGQLLVTLDDREIRHQLAAAEAQLHQAQTEYDRAKALFAKEATTQQMLTAAESMLAGALAQVEQVKVMLTYTRVVSPIDGIVADRSVESGDLANPGTLLLAVYDPLRMRIECPVPVRLIERVTLGQTVEVAMERPARVFQGRVDEIVSEVDASSRTQLVKVHLQGVEGDVLPGTFGRIWVEAGQRETIFVPSSAVANISQLTFVQVVENGQAMRRLVKTGPVREEEVEILSGLRPGDIILADPIPEG